MSISVEKHKMLMLAAEGGSLQPFEADHLLIHPGNMYRTILEYFIMDFHNMVNTLE